MEDRQKLLAKGKFLQEMLDELKDYLKKFGPNVTLSIVSRKFARLCIKHGGFKAMIDELVETGEIVILTNSGMTKIVWLKADYEKWNKEHNLEDEAI